MTFALSLLPMMVLVGLGVDYGRGLTVKTELDTAADAAALSAVANSVNQYTLPTPAAIQTYFSAAVGSLPAGTTYTVTAASSTNVTTLSTTVNYTAEIPTVFGGLVGLPTIKIYGTASSSGQLPTYVNFYLLLDNSPSMGVAATDADIANLEALTVNQPQGSCAFACHQHTYANGYITGDLLTDNYHVAKNNGVTTRIDVLRTATQSLMTTATNAETVPNQFQMALYTFSDNFQTLSRMTPSLTSVQSAAGAFDLAYSYADGRDAQSAYDTALFYINNIIPFSGDGSTAAQPEDFLFLVTDGVEDEPVGARSGSGDAPEMWANGASGAPPNTQPNLTNSQTGNANPTRLITTLSESTCDSIKSRGVKIAILYTPYLPPLTFNQFYNNWVAPISANIPTQLQNCASPGFFFQITPTQGISQAMQAMFQAAVSAARLTH